MLFTTGSGLCQAIRSGDINRTSLAVVSVLWSSQARLPVISELKEPTLTRCD